MRAPARRTRGPAGRASTGTLAPLAPLQPAALGRDQHRLRAIDGAELAVDVVQVRAHGARRQRQLVGDLLVDLAFGEALQHAELAAGQRARVDVPLALAGGARQFVHHAPELVWPE